MSSSRPPSALIARVVVAARRGVVPALLAATLACQTASRGRGDDERVQDGDGERAIDDDAPALADERAPDDDDERVLSAVRTARAKVEACDAAAALVEVDRALADHPSSGLLHLERAQLGQHLGLPADEIARSLDVARVELPDNPRVHFAVGAFAESEGRTQDAIAAYRATLALRAEHGDAELRLGRLLLDAGELGEARLALERAATLMPTSVPAQLALADVAERAGDLPTAERALLAVVNVHPSVAGHRQRLIAFYRRTGQTERERDAVRALERIDPRDERKLRGLRPSRR